MNSFNAWCERVLRSNDSLDLKAIGVLVMVYVLGLSIRALELVLGG